MERESLFRLALVSHEQAPATLRRYISLLAKLSVYKTPKIEFTPGQITLLIKKQYELVFSETEITDTLKSDSCFIFDNERNLFYLSSRGIKETKEYESPKLSLSYFIDKFLTNFYPEIAHDESFIIKEKINEYIYYSFICGKETLLSLVNCSIPDLPQIGKFEANQEQRRILSEFLNWDNNEKNRFIYEIVSYCVDYGMITAKVDRNEYVKFFAGKRFILDTNVILRLIGLDNEEKQSIIEHFVKRCLDVDIELCYTNITYNEILHTLPNIIRIIEGISAGDELISPDTLDYLGDYKYSDQYEMYYSWCKEKQGKDTDLKIFHDYLVKNVDDCIRKFKRIDIHNYEMIQDKNKDFNNYVSSLAEFKSGRKHKKPIYKESVKNDINNFIFIKTSNELEKNQTQECSNFIITADFGYYEWARKILPGVPLVFQPSEWLSIILKFTNRTESDYVSFCKFINLGYKSDDKATERATQIILSVNEITTDVDVKREVIQHIAATMNINVNNTMEETRKLVKAAYDEIKQKEKDEEIERLNRGHQKDTKDLEQRFESEKKMTKYETKDSTIKSIAKYTVDKQFKTRRWIKKNIKLLQVLSSVLSFSISLLISNTALKDIIIAVCSNTIMKTHEFEVTIILSTIIAAIIVFSFTLHIVHISSDEHYKKRLSSVESDLSKNT